MNAIDIPIKIWNQYIDLKNGDDLPLKIKIELFEKRISNQGRAYWNNRT